VDGEEVELGVKMEQNGEAGNKDIMDALDDGVAVANGETPGRVAPVAVL
jgi:hypothetical protein